MTTRQNLEDKLKKAEELVKSNSEAYYAERNAKVVAENEIKEVHKQFADLKERLSNSEMENQRLRGYIARVQEDDTVREELIATGGPDGEQTMVPKRKTTLFMQPDAHSQLVQQDQFGYHDERRPKPKHWVNY